MTIYLSSRQALVILRSLFPERRQLNYSHLSYYKRHGIVEASGRRIEPKQHADSFALQEVVLIAWMLEMKKHGLCLRSIAPFARRIIKQYDLSSLDVAADTVFKDSIGELAWQYPIGRTFKNVWRIALQRYPNLETQTSV